MAQMITASGGKIIIPDELDTCEDKVIEAYRDESTRSTVYRIRKETVALTYIP
jgi:hypothetical protein